MSYDSKVGILVSENAYKKTAKAIISNYPDSVKKDDKGNHYFEWNWTNWDEDFSSIKAILTGLKELDSTKEEYFGFIRIGENYSSDEYGGDFEYRSNNIDYILYSNVKIVGNIFNLDEFKEVA